LALQHSREIALIGRFEASARDAGSGMTAACSRTGSPPRRHGPCRGGADIPTCSFGKG
jgi:hypothetical protein